MKFYDRSKYVEMTSVVIKNKLNNRILDIRDTVELNDECYRGYRFGNTNTLAEKTFEFIVLDKTEPGQEPNYIGAIESIETMVESDMDYYIEKAVVNCAMTDHYYRFEKVW